MDKDYNTSLREGGINPLTGLPYSDYAMDKWKDLQEQKMAEPDIIKAFNQKVLDNDITIVSAGTGVGKTVLAPAHLLKLYKYKAKIALTQPKRLLTQSNSAFIAKGILDTKPGEYVSYQYRFKNTVGKKTKLTLMTDAILVGKLVSDPEEYDIVMIDEIHERNINMDLIMFLINYYYSYIDFWRNQKKDAYTEKELATFYKPKKLKNPTKFVLLSATLDASELINYFQSASNVKVGLFEVSGRAFPITNYFFGEDIMKNMVDYEISKYMDYTKEIVDKILIDKRYSDGDILVFLPRKSDIEEAVKYFSDKYSNKYYFGGLYSGIAENKQELAIDENLYKEKGLGKRKIIFSTPVAEAGLTVKGIKYVIETGVTNEMTIDQNTGFRILKVMPINISSSIQRCGRGGRTGPGTCMHAYPKEYYEKEFGKSGTPKIYSENVQGLIMKVMKYTSNIDMAVKVLSSKVLSPIDKNILDANTLYLYKKNIINTADGTFSDAGEFISRMDLDIDLALLAINGFFLKIPKIMIIITAMMSQSRNPKDFFKFKIKIINGKRIQQNQAAYSKYKNNYGDPIVFINLFRFFYTKFQKRYTNVNVTYYEKKLKSFCLSNDLNFEKFRDIMKVIYNTEKKINEAYKKVGKKLEIPDFPKDLHKMSEEEKIILAFKRLYYEDGNKAVYNPIKKKYFVNIDKMLKTTSPFLKKRFYSKKKNYMRNIVISHAELLMIGDDYRTSCDFAVEAKEE